MKLFRCLEERVSLVLLTIMFIILPLFHAGQRAFSALRLLGLYLVSINTLDV